MDKDRVWIVIPTLNEEETIGWVIDEFKRQGYANLLVIDGHSTDRTVEVARERGAKVILQEGFGKGDAVRQALRMVDGDAIVLIDGDGTYLPSEVEKLLEPIRKGYADHVIGNRFAKDTKGAISKLNMIGNKILNRLFGVGYGVWLNDILSGYRALRVDAARRLDLGKSGFEIEAEMTIESVKKELRVMEVPVSYVARRGSDSKLRPLRDGTKIGYTIYGLAKTYNPLFYFGFLGFAFIVAGLICGINIIFDFMHGREVSIPLTVLTTLLILTGTQIIIFGALGNLIVILHRETIREIHRRG